MKSMSINRAVCAILPCMTLILTCTAFPAIENLSVSQNSSRMLTASFTLSEKAVITMDILTNGVSIGPENYRTVRDAKSPVDEFPANRIVEAGEHVFTWRPVKEWPGFSFANGELEVSIKAWSLDSPPDYMVIDSSSVSNAPHFYATAADIPEGGIKTADPEDETAVEALKADVYRTTKLILRKIPAAGVKWRMGSPEDESYRRDNETPHYVTLTNDYYVSIYPMTFTQSRLFLSSDDALAVNINPKYNQSYNGLRGKHTDGYCWPDDGYAVGPNSRIGNMRSLTGLRFDLLTEAEWEFACRAGTEGPWNDDGTDPSTVAWTSYTGDAKGYVVGLKTPNAWGLYDMHGLVNEWVLDQYGEYPTDPQIAPVGVTTNSALRIQRGGPTAVKVNGSYGNSRKISTRSAFRRSESPSKNYDGNNNGYGVRISCPAALPDWLR